MNSSLSVPFILQIQQKRSRAILVEDLACSLSCLIQQILFFQGSDNLFVFDEEDIIVLGEVHVLNIELLATVFKHYLLSPYSLILLFLYPKLID